METCIIETATATYQISDSEEIEMIREEVKIAAYYPEREYVECYSDISELEF